MELVVQKWQDTQWRKIAQRLRDLACRKKKRRGNISTTDEPTWIFQVENSQTNKRKSFINKTQNTTSPENSPYLSGNCPPDVVPWAWWSWQCCGKPRKSRCHVRPWGWVVAGQWRSPAGWRWPSSFFGCPRSLPWSLLVGSGSHSTTLALRCWSEINARPLLRGEGKEHLSSKLKWRDKRTRGLLFGALIVTCLYAR